MAVTRAKATSLLNATEMGLYDDSRANALRGHSEAQLARLITRARTARDRARDLQKRQRLASRTKTGSKSGRSGQANARTGEKAELLADILTRLEGQHRETAKAAKAAARVKPAKTVSTGKKAAKKATATGTAAAARTAAKKKTPTKAVTKKTAVAKKAASTGTTKAKKATTRTGAARAAASTNDVSTRAPRGAKKAASSTFSRAASRSTAATPRSARKTAAAGDTPRASRRRITPEQALENTRSLLAQHTEDAGQPKHWDAIGGDGTAQSAPGYQSQQARSKALALHAGETRQASINGSISTRDRRNQGKRDHRSKSD